MKGLYIGSIVAVLQLFAAVKCQAVINLCDYKNQAKEALSSGTIQQDGEGNKCLCTGMPEKGGIGNSFVNIELHLSLKHNGDSGIAECFPRMGVQASQTSQAFHVCPVKEGEEEATKLVSNVQIRQSEKLLIGIDNLRVTTYNAEIMFTSDHNLTFTCVPDSPQAIMSSQVPWGASVSDGDSGGSLDPNDNSVAVGVGIAVGLFVVIVLVVLLVVFLYRAKKAKAAEKDPNELEEGDKNPGFEKDSLHSAPGAKPGPMENDKQPIQSAAPVPYSNVNLNPMPNNGPGMTKQSSIGNLSVASSVSSIGAPDLGAGVIHTAGVGNVAPAQMQAAPMRAPAPMQAAPAPMRAPIVQAEPAPMPMHVMQAEPAPMPYVRSVDNGGYSNPEAVHTEI